jgi:hypothetical protein
MYPQRSRILALLTELTSLELRTFNWAPEHQKAFDNMPKWLKMKLHHYPGRYRADHSKLFYIYTDASGLQLGAVIM